MRISFFAVKINLQSGGGSHRTLDLKMRYLAEHGHDVSLTTVYSKGNRLVASVPYAISELDASGKRFIEVQKFVVAEMKKQEDGVDIFHLDGPSFIWAAGMYRKGGGKKPVVCFVNNYEISMGMYHKEYANISDAVFGKLYQYKRWCWDKFIGTSYSKHIDRIYFDSPVIEKIYHQFGVQPKDSKVLPEFIDVQALGQESEVSETFSILYTGRLMYDKGIDLLVNAVANIKDVKVDIIGSGPQTEEIKNLISKNNLSHITLHEWMSPDELNKYYSRASVFVHPSRWPEPFGRTIVEAMAHGLPIITATKTGSAWVAGEAGIIFNNNNLQSLKSAINKLKDSPELQRDLSEKAKKRAAFFDYRSHATTLEKELVALAG